jgi:transposase
MLAALIAGERDPKVLAELARGRMRAKRSVLEEAFTGAFTDHHGFLLARMLGRVDGLDADIAELDHKLEELIIPFTAAADRLDEITGVGRTAACAIIAEVGVDMDDVGRTLEDQGVAGFHQSFTHVLQALQSKARQLAPR